MQQASGSRGRVALDRAKLVGVACNGQKLGTEKHSLEKGIGGDVKQPVTPK